MKTGEMARKGRKRAGLTLQEAADATGRSTSALSMLERDQTNPMTPEDALDLSSAYRDRQLAVDYCDGCALRKIIIPHKFKPLNNIDRHPAVSTMKLMQKISELTEKLPQMVSHLMTPSFRSAPDFEDLKASVGMDFMHVKRGMEILLQIFQERGIYTSEELKMLELAQQQYCEERGYHVSAQAEV